MFTAAKLAKRKPQEMSTAQKATFSYYHNFHHPTIYYING